MSQKNHYPIVQAKVNEREVNIPDSSVEITELEPGTFNFRMHNRKYHIKLLEHRSSEKHYKIFLDGKLFEISLLDTLDQLIRELGLRSHAAAQVQEVKAPMPGLVLSVLVSEGDKVREGDPLFILEAMKMENAITAPADGTAAKIPVKSGQKVDKNETLMKYG